MNENLTNVMSLPKCCLTISLFNQTPFKARMTLYYPVVDVIKLFMEEI